MTTEPIRRKDDIEALKDFFLRRGKTRDYALFVAGINTALRISDLLHLKWSDIFLENGNFRNHILVSEQKTGKAAVLFLNESARGAFELLFRSKSMPLATCANEYVFKSSQDGSAPISRFRAYQIIKRSSRKLGLDGNISCHSLRKTFGYHAWKMGASPTLIMNVYNHSSFEITKRYLGISQDDKDDVYRGVNL